MKYIQQNEKVITVEQFMRKYLSFYRVYIN